METENALPRPLPVVTEMNRYFWCGGADGFLHILRCGDCGNYIFPHGPTCPKCWSWNVTPVAVSGRGRIRALSINYQPWFPNIPVPYAVVLVELEEQSNIRLLTNMKNCAVEDVKAGMAVKVAFDRYDDIYFPVFEPA